MSSSSEDILNQRRLRAAEIALETARRRRSESDETLRGLRAEVADAEAALAAVMAARERDREAAQAVLAVAQRAQLVAEQALVQERHRCQELEHRVGELAREGSAREHLERQLAAEVKIRELEAEVELVLRRAAEFEYGVRMAAFDALKLVRGLVARVTAVMPNVSLPLPELGRGDPEAASGAGAVDSEAGTVEHGYSAAHPSATGLDSERLDAALERLRASIPPPADAE